VSRARRSSPLPQRPCCMISEILEEAGIDRERARAVRRQILEGVILLCQWQLERMERASEPRSGRRPRRQARQVVVE
jgi:hypothetical protein